MAPSVQRWIYRGDFLFRLLTPRLTHHTHTSKENNINTDMLQCACHAVLYTAYWYKKKTKEREREFQWFDPCIGGLLQKKRYSWQSMRIVHNGWISMHSRKMETACHLAHIFRSLCDICCCCRYFFFPILLDVFQHIHCACVNRPLHLRSERWTICFLFLAVCVCVLMLLSLSWFCDWFTSPVFHFR